MHASVRDVFREFNEPIEGVVRHMYLDIKGLVTVGVGNLIDPVSEALGLPFQYKLDPKRKASAAEIEREWLAVKGNAALAKSGAKAAAKITQLELSEAAIGQLVQKRLAGNERQIRKLFPGWDAWPADAQLGLLSMAWALGVGALPVKFPKFCESCQALDFTAASAQCKISEKGNAGVAPRNMANQQLFRNAAMVLAKKLDISVLRYRKRG